MTDNEAPYLASLLRDCFCRGLFPALELALDRFANESGSFLPIGRAAAILSKVPAANFAPTRSGHRFFRPMSGFIAIRADQVINFVCPY